MQKIIHVFKAKNGKNWPFPAYRYIDQPPRCHILYVNSQIPPSFIIPYNIKHLFGSIQHTLHRSISGRKINSPCSHHWWVLHSVWPVRISCAGRTPSHSRNPCGRAYPGGAWSASAPRSSPRDRPGGCTRRCCYRSILPETKNGRRIDRETGYDTPRDEGKKKKGKQTFNEHSSSV